MRGRGGREGEEGEREFRLFGKHTCSHLNYVFLILPHIQCINVVLKLNSFKAGKFDIKLHTQQAPSHAHIKHTTSTERRQNISKLQKYIEVNTVQHTREVGKERFLTPARLVQR